MAKQKIYVFENDKKRKAPFHLMYYPIKNIPSTDHYEVNETRTLLVTNIAAQEDHQIIKDTFSLMGDIKETYTIAGRNILFVIFYDVRTATSVKNTYDNQRIGSSVVKISYTVSKYEIPKEGDVCDESRNQGTLLLVSRDLAVPLTESEIIGLLECYGEIKEIREYRPFQKFVEFYDARCTVKAFEGFGTKEYKGGKLTVRYLWDMNKKRRWEFIKQTDDILTNACSIEPSKHRKLNPPKQLSQKPPKHFILEALDKFILENLDPIENLFKK